MRKRYNLSFNLEDERHYAAHEQLKAQPAKQQSEFNAGRKKEEALALLSKWLPYAEAFTEMVRRNEDRFKVLEAENKGLEQQIERKTELLDEAFVDVAVLRETAEKQRKLLDKLPPDVLKELRNQSLRGKSR